MSFPLADCPESQPCQERAFAEEFHRFTNFCQGLVAAAEFHERSLLEVAECMVRALPEVRSPAQFIVLRGIVSDFAGHAAGQDRDLQRHVAALARLTPTDNLGAVLMRCFSAPDPPEPRRTLRSVQRWRAERVLSAVTDRCTDPTLSIAAIAEATQISATYVRKPLHAAYGFGFRTALRRARVRVGKELLRGSSKSVKEIAGAAGYQSTSQFDRDFKREYGVTPGEYRRESS